MKKGLECSEGELAKFCTLVTKSGEVQTQGLFELVREAEYLAFHYADNGSLVGIGALKRPRSSYKMKVFQKSGTALSADEYNLELGWLYTKPEFRGKGITQAIVGTLLSKIGCEKVFATTRKDDAKHILKKFKFTETGKRFESSRRGYRLSLFVRG